MALKDATTGSPTRSASRSTDAVVTSATSGPTATRARLPVGVIRAIGARRWLTAESSGTSREQTSQGYTVSATLPATASVDHIVPPASRTISVSPRGSGAAAPGTRSRSRETGDEGIARRCDELARRADLEQPSVDDDAHAVGERGCVLEIVRDEDDREAQLAKEVVELAAHGRPGMGVERRERLVEEQHVRVAGERPRERDALTLAARDLPGPGIGEPSDPEPLEQPVDRATITSAVRDVPPHAQVREQRVVLEHEPDRPALRRHVDATCGVEPRHAVECDAAAPRPEEPRDGPQDARLARPRRPDERERPRRDLERQLEVERAKGVGKLCVEDRHDGISLTASNRTALAATSSAPIARAVSKSTSNCS